MKSSVALDKAKWQKEKIKRSFILKMSEIKRF
jgi:hypothetical protein